MSISAGLLLYIGLRGNGCPSSFSTNSRNFNGAKWVWASIRARGVPISLWGSSYRCIEPQSDRCTGSQQQIASMKFRASAASLSTVNSAHTVLPQIYRLKRTKNVSTSRCGAAFVEDGGTRFHREPPYRSRPNCDVRAASVHPSNTDILRTSKWANALNRCAIACCGEPVSGVCEHWSPNWPGRGLSFNELRALISMMARSTTLQQRPDTLMQDRSPPTQRNPLATTAGPYIRATFRLYATQQML